jgi:hypothetical protein
MAICIKASALKEEFLRRIFHLSKTPAFVRIAPH